jgi:hypothetical protein
MDLPAVDDLAAVDDVVMVVLGRRQARMVGEDAEPGAEFDIL